MNIKHRTDGVHGANIESLAGCFMTFQCLDGVTLLSDSDGCEVDIFERPIDAIEYVRKQEKLLVEKIESRVEARLDRQLEFNQAYEQLNKLMDNPKFSLKKCVNEVDSLIDLITKN